MGLETMAKWQICGLFLKYLFSNLLSQSRNLFKGLLDCCGPLKGWSRGVSYPLSWWAGPIVGSGLVEEGRIEQRLLLLPLPLRFHPSCLQVPAHPSIATLQAAQPVLDSWLEVCANPTKNIDGVMRDLKSCKQ